MKKLRKIVMGTSIIILMSGCGGTSISSPSSPTQGTYVPAPTNASDESYTPQTQFGVWNRCGYTVWIQEIDSTPGANIRKLTKLESNYAYDYPVNNNYINSFRVWPKMGCDANGQNCKVGQQVTPCTNCQPPVDSLFEGTFNNGGVTNYDDSLVNGYTLPFVTLVHPSSDEGSPTCESAYADALSLANCPTSENLTTTESMSNFGGDSFGPFATESVYGNPNFNMASVNEQSLYPTTGQVQGCMSPGTVLTFSTTIIGESHYFGGLNLGANDQGYAASFAAPVIMYTCPFRTSQLLGQNVPSIDPQQIYGFNNISSYCTSSGACVKTDPHGTGASQMCALGPVNSTQYVKYVNSSSTRVYGQPYSDSIGGLACNSSQSKIDFILCPNGNDNGYPHNGF